MSEERPESGQREVRFTGGAALQAREPRSWKPLAIAAAVVLVVILVIFVLGHRAKEQANPGGTGLAPAAAYAASLPITQVQMSDASTMSGNSQTYLDGIITNRGTETVTNVTVQVAFKGFTSALAGKETLPLTLIRSREPYVDIEPVSAAPLKPGDSQPFRLIFDSVPQDWNTQYPEVRIIEVSKH